MYNNYPYQNPYQGYYNSYQQPTQQLQPKTNKIWVTSVEDALSKSVELNSEYVYLHQDKPLLIEVKTDSQGRKTTRVMELKDYIDNSNDTSNAKKNSPNNFVSKEELESVKAEIQALKEKIDNVIVD